MRRYFKTEAKAEAFVRRINRFTKRVVMFVQHCGGGIYSVDIR